MTYRAAPITQRDGSALASSNCRMASIATGLDYETHGAKRSTGAKMRSYTDDQSGGTDSGDAVQSWSRGYGESLRVRDGATFDDALADLHAGRLVHLDTWHASVGGPCLSGSGAYGHTMAVAPEQNGSRWLVADPWCSPGKYVWTEESRLRAGAEEWGGRVFRSTGGSPRRRLSPAERLAAAKLVGKLLMALYYPGREAPAFWRRSFRRETGGAQPILYTTTSVGGGSNDMAMQAASGLTSGYSCDVSAGLDFYADAELKSRLGEMSKAARVRYVGGPIGEQVTDGSRAVLVSTGSAYSDGQPRPTVVYVSARYCSPTPDPTPPTDVDAAIAEAIAARDSEWADAIMSGEPWPEAL